MSRKRRIVTTALMAFVMCGIMSLLIVVLGGGAGGGMAARWIRNWIIAVIALYPVAYRVTPAVAKWLQEANVSGLPFRVIHAGVLAGIYAFWMTFVMAVVNVGLSGGLIEAWMNSFRLLVGIAFILLFLLTPVVSLLAGILCGE